jgi:hypothetical protein
MSLLIAWNCDFVRDRDAGPQLLSRIVWPQNVAKRKDVTESPTARGTIRLISILERINHVLHSLALPIRRAKNPDKSAAANCLQLRISILGCSGKSFPITKYVPSINSNNSLNASCR